MHLKVLLLGYMGYKRQDVYSWKKKEVCLFLFSRVCLFLFSRQAVRRVDH